MKNYRVIGKSLPRIEGIDKATGRASFAGDARSQLLQLASKQMEARTEDLMVGDGLIWVKGSPNQSLPISEVVLTSLQKGDGNPVVGRGYVRSVPDAERYPGVSAGRGRYTNAYSFAAQIAEVEVDIETGGVMLPRAGTVYDCGYPLNPGLCVGQVEGCVSMAQGQALTENVMIEDGPGSSTPPSGPTCCPALWTRQRTG